MGLNLLFPSCTEAFLISFCVLGSEKSLGATGEEIRKGVINERVGTREIAAGDPTCSAASARTATWRRQLGKRRTDGWSQ